MTDNKKQETTEYLGAYHLTGEYDMIDVAKGQRLIKAAEVESPCVDCVFFQWDSIKQRCANWKKRVCYIHMLQVYHFLSSDNDTGIYH